jgi:hypothetical protein
MAGNLSAQNIKNDTAHVSLSNDTLPGKFQAKGDTIVQLKEKGDIESTIKYSARDSIRMDVVKKIVYLYGDASINYGDITLTAALVSIDWDKSVMTANALPDSTGKLTGVPVFTQGSDNYEAEQIKYNFKTKKGIISKIVTTQGEGFVTGDKVKRDEDAIYISRAQYTTCNLRHPHFYINARKLKVIPEDKVVSGPFNLVISDVHTPLGFFLGFFPIPKKQKSGIIFPTFGMSPVRGLFLSRGGYYWAVNDYMNLKIIGDIYSNSSWNATLGSEYRVKYRYGGNLSLSAGRQKGTFSLGENPPYSYALTWTHAVVPKRNRSFSAHVDISSQKYYQTFSYNPQTVQRNTSNSNILYTKTFGGTPFSLTAAASQNQNISGSKITMDFFLPDITLAMNRIYPFKPKINPKQNWYENISFGYTLKTRYFTTNRPITFSYPLYNPSNAQQSPYERSDTLELSNGGFGQMLKTGQWSAVHSIPISTTMKVLKYFNLSPSFTFNQYFYDRYLDYLTDQTPIKVRVVPGFVTAYDYTFSTGLSTSIYGTYNIRSRRLLAIRHTAIPTIGYSIKPDFSRSKYNNYERTPAGGLLSRFDRIGYGAPSSGKSNSLNFSINNNIQGKVRTKNDTANPTKKIDLIRSITAGGSYNFSATNHMGLTLAPIVATTTLFKIIQLTASYTFDPYKYRLDSTSANGLTHYQTYLNPKSLTSSERSLAQFRRSVRYSVNLSANLNPKAFKKTTPVKPANPEVDLIRANPDLYVDFNIPWNLAIGYVLNYQRIGFAEATTTTSLTLSGDLSISEKWKITFSSGYDFINKGITYSMLTLNRDLHCWQMSFNVVPFGTLKSYFFTLSAKSSILQDLKVNKRSPAYTGMPY